MIIENRLQHYPATLILEKVIESNEDEKGNHETKPVQGLKKSRK